uniref:Uncharacterized protein n=1 Tax=Rhizophora mucronata TaxID=61149 RepID=A0A2P2QK36_RHIMU
MIQPFLVVRPRFIFSCPPSGPN